MRHAFSIRALLTATIATAIGPVAASQAAVLYKTGFGNYDTAAAVGYNPNNASFTTNISTYTATGGSAASVAAGGRGEGRGDDYSTNFTSLTLTSLRFVGALQPSADGLAIEFYNADGTRNAAVTIYPSNDIAELRTATAHTVTLSSPRTISGSGYIVFAPYTFNYDAGPNPAISLGYSDGSFTPAAPDVGTNNAATSVEANYSAAYPMEIVTSLTAIDVPFTADRLSLQLDGTGIGLLPEPATLALLAPVAMLLKRRRRQD